jgi:hypothetical protein
MSSCRRVTECLKIILKTGSGKLEKKFNCSLSCDERRRWRRKRRRLTDIKLVTNDHIKTSFVHPHKV